MIANVLCPLEYALSSGLWGLGEKIIGKLSWVVVWDGDVSWSSSPERAITACLSQGNLREARVTGKKIQPETF